MTDGNPEHLFIRAGAGRSPLYRTDAGMASRREDFTRETAVDDPAVGLPPDLARELTEWAQSFPDRGSVSRPALRKHVKRGLEIARRVARFLGPRWVVRYWDEQHQDEKFVCWGCDRFHWTADAHTNPPHPLDITVEGEAGMDPLRAEGFGYFAPDDPAAGLHLPDDLVTAFKAWGRQIDETLELDLPYQEEDRYADEWQRLFIEGRDLSERLARELGPARTVTYKGLANGGLATLTSETWQGDQQVKPH
ncbi:hypothetical protein [Streptomyces camelliae]|uniref:Uncharacterized protein n=1 Tax=Streptomyces camelliae TaxID=3004093 RepID=A0ABY7NZY4_9ACTN|nr:hypothetical protein [Streptomyces sp. HUAS 2-6]WBO63816.1 hypothetical protein O1G22_13765 [Streptomyces sp. HUAS 2-6]